jgi:hypothetical protein
MPLINTSVPNLIQGVSQQPDAVRFAGQCDEQENALASVVDGLQKRPATKHVATLLSEVALDSDAKVHFIERDDEERYVIIIKGDDKKTISAYNLKDGRQAVISQSYRGVVSSFKFQEAPTDHSHWTGSSCQVTFTNDCPVTIPRGSTTLLGVARVVGGGGISTKEFSLINVADTVAGDPAITQLNSRQIHFALGTVQEPTSETSHPSITLHGAGTGEMQSVIEYTILAIRTGLGHTGADLVLDEKNYLNLKSTTYAASYRFGKHTTTPREDLQLMTTGDVTYLLNTSKPTRLDYSRTRPVNKDALVFIKQGDYEKKYGVRVSIEGEDTDRENWVYSGPSQKLDSSDKFYNTAKNAQSDYILKTLFSASVDAVTDASTDHNVNPAISNKLHSTNLGLLRHGRQPDTSEPPSTNFSLPADEDGNHPADTVNWPDAASGITYNPFLNSNIVGFGAELLSPQLGVIRGPSFNNFTVYPVDSTGGAHMGVAHKAVTSVTDLPKIAPHRFKVKVQGDIEEGADDRYVQFLVSGSDDNTPTGEVGQGSWSEIGGDNIPNRIDATTMPLMLRNTAENEFVLSHMPLDERLSGDENTNPDPSFIDAPLSGMFHYKGRLGFLSGASVSMTEVKFGSYDGVHGTQNYNFYRTSVASLLDNDPIDVTVASTQVVNLNHAIAFQDSLVMFSDFGQFVLKSGDLLTASTVSATPITSFDTEKSVSPLALGSYLYFPFARGKNIGVREFTVNANTDVFDANEITAHVPQYIPQKINSLTGKTSGIVGMTGTSSDELIAITDGIDIYIYKYFFSGNEKVLSSWSKFTLSGGGIRGIGFIEADLFVVQALESTNQTHLLKIPLEGKQRDDEGYNTHLDRRVEVEFDASKTTESVLTVPYLLAEGETLQAYTKDGRRVQGVETTQGETTTTLTFKNPAVPTGIPEHLNLAVSYPANFTRRGITVTNPGASIPETPLIAPFGPALDLQTSLFWQAVTITNNAAQEIPSFRLFVSLPDDVYLYGAYVPGGGHEANDNFTAGDAIENRRYIHHLEPLAAGASATVTILYYQQSTAGDFTPAFTLGVPGNELYVGIPYTMKYTFSEQLFKAAGSDKPSPTNSGRMLIRNGSLFFTDTGHFVVKVTPDLRNTSEAAFNASVLHSTVEGSMPLESNSFRFPVFTDPKGTVITIENATAAPCNLQSAEFESFVHQRSKRYG